MRISVRWLKKYLPLDLSVSQIVETLTLLGLEVESVVDLGLESKKFVTCQILEMKPHPNADNLTLCSVMADEAKPLDIVCGAKNMKPGDRVVLAKVGAKIPVGGITIKAARIRGVESNGMLCSATELGIAEDAKGLMILPADTPIAEPFDALLTIKVTPNRPDCLSMLGVARELAAATRTRVSLPSVKVTEGADRIDSAVRIQVKAREECPRYAARVVRNITVGPSPLWLARAVEAGGLRSINNIVDVTNYILLELGQPLHAFDLDTVAQRTVIVRTAEAGETIQTLDGEKLPLQAGDLVIADPEGPIALAGIMGGGRTEISEKSKNVLLEAAYFRPATIRATSKRLDKSTDSSYRFERGIDGRKQLPYALDRAAQLLAEVAGGEVLKGVADVQAQSLLPEQAALWLRLDRLNRVLDAKFTGREAADLLVALGFEVTRTEPQQIMVIAPAHRVDISREADLIEEIARLHGYGKIPAALPPVPPRTPAVPRLRELTTRLADLLVGAGYRETINYSFIAPGAADAYFAEGAAPAPVALKNPLASDQSVMRTTLLPGLLANAERNHNHGVLDIRLFEIGKTYQLPAAGAAAAPDDVVSRGANPAAAEMLSKLPPAPVEKTVLAVIAAGSMQANWNSPAADATFYDVKGLAEEILVAAGIRNAAFEPAADVPWLHPGRGAALTVEGRRVALFGELHPTLLGAHGLRKRLQVIEIALDELAALKPTPATFRELPRFPAVERDIALVVDRGVRALDLERALRAASRDNLESIRMFDLYQGQNIPAGKKSLAYKLTFRSAERTLTEEEVTAAMEKVLRAAESKFQATLRA